MKKAFLLPFFGFFLFVQETKKGNFISVFSFVNKKREKAIIVQIFTSGISCFAEME